MLLPASSARRRTVQMRRVVATCSDYTAAAGAERVGPELQARPAISPPPTSRTHCYDARGIARPTIHLFTRASAPLAGEPNARAGRRADDARRSHPPAVAAPAALSQACGQRCYGGAAYSSSHACEWRKGGRGGRGGLFGCAMRGVSPQGWAGRGGGDEGGKMGVLAVDYSMPLYILSPPSPL